MKNLVFIVLIFSLHNSFAICEMFGDPALYGEDSYNDESYLKQRDACLYNSVKNKPINQLRGELKNLKIKYMNKTCTDLGFKKNTKDYNNCLLELM